MKKLLNIIYLTCLICPFMIFGLDNAVILTGNSNPELAHKVAENLNMKVSEAIVSQFNDGELRIRIKDSVRNKNVYVIQSTCASENKSVNDNIMELYLMIRTLKRS